MVNLQPVTLSQTGPQPTLEELHASLQPKRGDQYERLQDHFVAVAGEHPDPVLVIGASDVGLIRALAAGGHAVDIAEPTGPARTRLAQAALTAGFHAVLYAVPVDQLDLPGAYGSILIPRSMLSLLLDRAQVVRALTALKRHLEPGGALSFDLYGPPAWQPQAPEWSEESRPSQTERLVAERRLLRVDPLEQIYAEQRIFRLFQGEQLVRQSYRSSTRRWYTRHEITLLLTWAGFQDIQVSPTFIPATHRGPGRQTSGWVFTAGQSSTSGTGWVVNLDDERSHKR
jgi:hypothetical protein